MKPDKSIEFIEPFNPNRRCPVLLDANAVHPFLTWLSNNTTPLENLETGRWRIGVLKQHVDMRDDWDVIKKEMDAAKVTILEDNLTSKDELLVSEILNAYFGGNGIHRKSARLLAYGRKYNEDGDDVQVISRLRIFRLVPSTQLYFVPNVDYMLINNDDAMILRALDMLSLHKSVHRVAYERIVNHDNPIAIDQAVKTLIDEIRQIGVDHNLPFATVVNDRPMVEQALRMTAPGEPHIRLNALNTTTERNEQQGYHNIISGVVAAVRNPLAHGPVDLPFLQARFGDRRTALKFLCLLSLLFEKLDKRVAP